MVAMMLAGPDVVIIIVVVLLLFGGTKLAGLGKSAGRALREFKEETSGLVEKDAQDAQDAEDTDTSSVEPAETSEHQTPPVAR